MRTFHVGDRVRFTNRVINALRWDEYRDAIGVVIEVTDSGQHMRIDWREDHRWTYADNDAGEWTYSGNVEPAVGPRQIGITASVDFTDRDNPVILVGADALTASAIINAQMFKSR
jgi:hypothetical protein